MDLRDLQADSLLLTYEKRNPDGGAGFSCDTEKENGRTCYDMAWLAQSNHPDVIFP